jgi:hypothetical protein
VLSVHSRARGGTRTYTPAVGLLLLGCSLLVLIELFERSLNRMGAGLPKPLLEESLELLAALYCFLAMIGRRQDPDGY